MQLTVCLHRYTEHEAAFQHTDCPQKNSDNSETNYKTVASVKSAFKTRLALVTANINWCGQE